MRDHDYLFRDGDLGGTLEAERQKLKKGAAELRAQDALAKGVDELSAELVERSRVEPLTIQWDQATVSVQDTEVDVSGDPMRWIPDRSGPFYVPGTTLTYHAPFTGDPMLFKLQPSRFTLSPPMGRVHGNELQISITRAAPLPDNFRGELDREIGQIKQYVESINADVAAYNRGLDAFARSEVERRRQKLLADRNMIASLGIPVRRTEDATPTYAVPPVRKKVATPATSPGSTPQKPEPMLPAETYEEILGIIRNMAMVIERSPKAFATMGEEDLRTHFLVQLNGQYEGTATGETFNFEGKTDILIRRDGRNTFIGECKFWGGQKKLTETIDQLLRYTSWRDTKTAILIFNRGRELSGLLSQISPTVQAHPNFVREISYGDETSFRFVLHHPDDKSRELTLTVLVFEVPS